MKFCPECGAKLSEGAKFCGSCGAKLICNEGKTFDVEGACKDIINIPEEGIFEEKITTDLLEKIKEAADNGVGIAAYILSRLYQYGFELDGKEAVPVDADKRLKYLLKAAEAGCHFAQGELGNELWVGFDCSNPTYEKGEHPDSFMWIEKAAKSGNVLALHRATYAYLDGGYGQKADWSKALECFHAIIAAKDTENWNEEWIERAIGYLRYYPQIIKGDTEAMRLLGEWLKAKESSWDWSWGIGEEIEESSFWLKKAKAEDEVDDDDKEEGEGLANEEAQLEAEFDDEDFDETGMGEDDDDEG
jgi:hypothetical protein